MKKKIFGGIAVVAIAVAVALNVSLVNNKADRKSSLLFENIEALASEGGGSGKNYYYVSCGDPYHPNYKECTSISGNESCGSYYKTC